ncbi:tetrahydrofolate dehydrogenase/cyclohydrolase catalytic domain-containing protein [uncultured Microscilla sp.]|uniref:tetrahydrofolate dehydrogenase/cyclohydrolase catalytic domain-containing protein n=1 Tax=uncultured Microscilla sp. TaxID=432653 RepID=UPI00260C8E9F|nr:tetrahydrofolate dehydrogenase/cyclohydrolase catalytic domain-containing protein [uncultured Microscilla sp.]
MDRKRHREIFEEIKKELQKPEKKNNTFSKFYKSKTRRAKLLEKKYQKRLKKGIKLKISFGTLEKEKKDQDIDFRVKIAPNNIDEEFPANNNGKGGGKGIKSPEKLLEDFKKKFKEELKKDYKGAVQVFGGVTRREVKNKYRPIFDKAEPKKKKKVVVITWTIDESDPYWVKHRASLSSAREKEKIFGKLTGENSGKNLGLGLEAEMRTLPTDISQVEFARVIDSLNKDTNIGAVIVQSPPPKGLENIVKKLNPKKDLDALSGDKDKRMFKYPATSEGIVRIVEPFAEAGKKIVVLGGGGFIGEGVITMLREKGVEPHIIDPRVVDDSGYQGKDLALMKKYDIIISTVGKEGLIKGKDLKGDHTLIVDTGFVPLENVDKLTSKNVKGDVDPTAKSKTKFVTPVPGGTGPVEMAVLMERVAKLFGIEVPSWKVEADNIESKEDGARLKLKVVFDK